MIYVLFSVFSSEKVPVSYGLGWDGAVYWKIASDFPNWVKNDSLSIYRVQRILPSGLVHYGLKTYDKISRLTNQRIIKPTPEVVINAFMLMNGVCVLLSVFYLLQIAEIMAFTHRQKVLFLTGIFFSFPFLKQIFYYPVLTDYVAFMIGTAMLYYYLMSNNLGLLCALIIGSYTFPTLIYCATILFLFPPNQGFNNIQEYKYLSFAPILLLITFVFLVVFYHLHNDQYLNIFLICLYLFFVLKDTSEPIKWLHFLKEISFWKRLIILLILIGLIKYSQFILSNEKAGALTFLDTLIYSVILRSIKYPLNFISAHLMFFGVVFLIPIFYWKHFVLEMKKLGVGFNVLIYVYFFLLLGSESRTNIVVFPYFILLSVIVLKEDLQRNWIFYSLIVLQLILSKFWYPINTSGIADTEFSPSDFPWQNWFMNSGYLVSETMYYVHSVILIVILCFFYLIKKYAPKS